MCLDGNDIQLVSKTKKVLTELKDIVADIRISDINAGSIIQVLHAVNEVRYLY